MQILIDTRERNPLPFQFVHGVSVKSECLKVGDYACRHSDNTMDSSVIERKSIPDLFHSFTHEYENEKKKIERAKELGFKYILAIEGTVSEILKGYSFKKDGIEHKVKKDGISQVRQIMTISRKYDVEVWWCKDRMEMQFMIQEYFFSKERYLIQKNKKEKTT